MNRCHFLHNALFRPSRRRAFVSGAARTIQSGLLECGVCYADTGSPPIRFPL